MDRFLLVLAVVAGSVLLLTGILHTLRHLGPVGRALASRCAHAPGLDLIIILFQIAPIVLGAIYAGWLGVAAAIPGQILGYFFWSWLHELANRKALKGPRIVSKLNQILGGGLKGALRNHLAVWATALALPCFLILRAAQIFVYPLLVWLLDFPRYPPSEWIRVSRHKFDGLVGHDLAWCLYCDWMTGVYSLGAEMLRNVESFWCPIRFDSEKKCANCVRDFPDVDGGWVPASAGMPEVVRKLEEKYGDGRREWFAHPARLTVHGKTPDSTSKDEPAESNGVDPK